MWEQIVKSAEKEGQLRNIAKLVLGLRKAYIAEGESKTKATKLAIQTIALLASCSDK